MKKTLSKVEILIVLLTSHLKEKVVFRLLEIM